MNNRADTPAFYEERIRLLQAERQQLLAALNEIVLWPFDAMATADDDLRAIKRHAAVQVAALEGTASV